MSIEISNHLAKAIVHQGSVDEAPHSFYRYPARFSPHFARAAIHEFTRPGEIVLDPFCGGGTSVVEAITLGRRAVGCDLNALAVFLAKAKTTLLSRRDKKLVQQWTVALRKSSDQPRVSGPASHDLEHYAKNLPDQASRFFQNVLCRIQELPFPRHRDFARLALLSTGQTLLDCKTQSPTVEAMMKMFCDRLCDNLFAHEVFLDSTARLLHRRRNQLNSMRHLMHASSEKIADLLPVSWQQAKLVLTSPPYPGVHVLYHRWQINGRRETPAAYWLANQKDEDSV